MYYSRRSLTSVMIRISTEITQALESSTGRTIWHLSEIHRFRLYKLWIWKQRYKVSLEYIFSVLVPYFTKGVEKRTGKRSRGLGVSIPVLTGDIAEDILKKAIERDWPDGDHLAIYRESERERILSILKPVSEFPVKIKSSLQYKTIREETKAYTRSIARANNVSFRVENKLKKIPFRGNPWL